MNCDATLGTNGLHCTGAAGHDHGHVYVASWAPDLPRDEEVRAS